MATAERFYALGDHYAIDLPGARALFTTRRGGHSAGPYRSLNLGLLTDDDRSAVQRNRAALQAQLGAAALSFVHQVHGADVRLITEPGDIGDIGDMGDMGDIGDIGGPGGPGGPEPTLDSAPRPRVDGQATNLPGVAPAALVADCLPIAVAGPGAVAVLHGGWRGLALGVIANGVRALRALGAGGELSAAIGPGAGGCCYEVGPEVHAAFAEVPEAHRGALLDLKAVARRRLQEAGVGTVSDIGICTICCDPELLFSHRRDHGVTGRQAGAAWLT